MVHSASSSIADDYYTYSQDDTTPTDSSSADAYYLVQQDHDQLSQHPSQLIYQSAAHPPSTVKKQASLANIAVPSFSTFRSQAARIPAYPPTKAARYTAAYLASPRPTSFSAIEQPSPRLAEPTSRPLSLDSPLPQHPSGFAAVPSPPPTLDWAQASSHRSSISRLSRLDSRAISIDSRMLDSDFVPPTQQHQRRSSIPTAAKDAGEPTSTHAPKQSISSISSGSEYSAHPLALSTSKIDQQPAPSMTLQFNGVQRTLSDESLSTTNSDQQRKSSIANKGLGALFGWKSSPQKSGTESPTTTFSDRSLSPAPSPHLQKPSLMDNNGGSARLTPPGLDIQKANARGSNYYDQNGSSSVHGSADVEAHVQELEQELTQISEELANSIRREMELEDELDRLKMGMPSDRGRRTSDYFSDSGTSTTKYPVADPEAKIEALERTQRKVEQEKAVIQAENAQRLQAESMRRRELEQYAQSLEEQLHEKSMHEDSRVGDLETTLDETKRRLGQEKEARRGIEDLYSATRDELEQHRNERDNLRDELLPQLKSRVEGLEAEVADTQALVYENTRLQQELHALKESHESLRNGQGQHSVFRSIMEEDDSVVSSPGGAKSGLSRSGSLARNGSKRNPSLTRNGSVKDREGGKARSGSITGAHGPLGLEAQKEVEDQRDALHKALKLLISRYEKQQREHERAMRKLSDQDPTVTRGITASSPKRSQYRMEVSYLKEEVSTLRKRTEDALEQKWQYEKGLSGIKMDLDRAEQETRSLRVLLQENDILAPSPRTLLDASDASTPSSKTVETSRDHARKAAEAYRQRALDLQESSSTDSESQPPAVTQLFDSANRMDDLAEQLTAQVDANESLRARLAEAVEKGEKEQKDSTRQIQEMQSRLAGLEDSVLAAQQHSELTLSTHETETRRIDEASSAHLQRLHISIPSPSPSPLSNRSPRIGFSSAKNSHPESLLEASKTVILERKVREMERALQAAEEDLQSVVQRVNRSQFEVAELTAERDVALAQMRKLLGLVGEVEKGAGGLM